MKLQCEQKDFSRAVLTVQRAVASRIVIPALSGILLTANKEEKTLTFRATDLELTIMCTVPSAIDVEGSIVLPGRFLGEICRNLSSDTVFVEAQGQNVSLFCGKSKYNLRTLPAEEFPERPELVGAKLNLAKGLLLHAIKKVSKAAARDESRPTISGVLIAITQEALEVVATDSYRLALFSSPINNGERKEEEVRLILPTRSLDEVGRIFGSDDSESFEVTLGDGEVAFSSDTVKLITRTIEGSFPQYKQIIPQDFEVKAEVDREELLGAVRRAAIVASSSPLKFQWQENSLEIRGSSQEVGEAQETLEADFSNDPFEVAFNPVFLQDGLQLIEGEKVEFKFNSPVKPGLITSAGDEGYVYLIMPVRLN